MKEVISTIIVSAIAALGGASGGFFAYRQFIIKRKDEKEKENIQSLIDEAIDKVRVELMEEFTAGLQLREDTGRERFEINSKAIEDNTRAIAELTEIVKNQVTKLDLFTESITALNKVVKSSAESQCNSNYDRLLMVASKVLNSDKITITEKTNLVQLYNSWKDLGGNDPKIDTMYEECMKLKVQVDDDIKKVYM